MKVIFTCGGTGGHIYPAIAVAKLLQERHPDCEILFIGAEDGMENRIARLIFAIPAVKGVEFGAGFAVAEMRGSENNDPFYYDGDTVKTRTNHAGGILGGITNGMPLVFRAAVKPTPSIARVQDSVSLSQGVDTKLEIHGRHDPCIVPRAVPCVEAAAAIAVYDALLSQQAIQQKEK